MADVYNPYTGRMEQAGASAPVDLAERAGIPKHVVASGKVPMLTDAGDPVFVTKDELNEALSRGYKYESPEESKARIEAKEYDAPVTAGALGALRGITFGGSDVAAHIVGKKDAVRKYKEHNPIASGVGEIGGVGALALATGGGSLAEEGLAAGGEAAAAAGAEGAATEATGGILSKVAANSPVGLASKVGKGVTESVAEHIVGEEGAKRVLGQAAAHAVGGAAEGALYGAGAGVSDVALQEEPINPTEAAEHIAASLGVGALVGGGIGAGVSLGGEGISQGASKLKKFVGGFGKPAETGVVDAATEAGTGSTLDSLNNQQMSYADAQRGIEKPNAAAIRNAATEEGVPLTQAQTSDSPFIQNTHSSLEQSSTFLGDGVKQEVAATREGMQRSAGNVLSDASQGETADSLGQKLRSNVENKIKAEHAELQEGYDSHSSDFTNIKVAKEDRAAIGAKMDKTQLVRISPNSAEAKIASQYAEDLQNVKNLSDLRVLTTKVNGEIRTAARADNVNAAEVLGHVKTQLNKLRDMSISNASLKATAGDVVGAEGITKDTIESIRGLDKRYALLNKKAAEISDELGIGKVKSIKQFYAKLENTSNEALARKMFNTNEAASMRYMKSEFPQEFEALRRYKLGEILNQSTKDGKIHIPTLLSKTKGYSPEAAREIFTPQGARSLKNLKTLSEAFPKMVGPSGTPQGQDFGNFLSPSYWGRYISDAGKLAALRGAGAYEKVATAQNKTIEGAFTKFFSATAQKVGHPIEIGFLKAGAQSLMPQIEHLASLSADPEKLTDQIAQNTKGLEQAHPDAHAALTNTLVEAVSFLQTKAPKNPGRDDVFGKSKWHPSDTEMAKFNRYVKAVDNPLSILQDFNSRVLTFEGVDAVKTIYPELYKKISEQAIEKASKQKSITFQDKIQLSILLQMPVNSAGDPKFIQRVQGLMQPVSTSMEDSSQQKLRPKGLDQIDRSTAAETPTEKLQRR